MSAESPSTDMAFEPRPRSLRLAGDIELGGVGVLPIIAGPCVIESAELTMQIAELLADMARRHDWQLIFKASFDKANRSSLDSFRGVGMAKGLEILRQIKEHTGLPVLTDVHEASQCAAVAEVCDVLQIPAFLCRQTDLLVAAASTGRAVNIKKGQFVAPEDMQRAVDKVCQSGNDRVCITERGYAFGYNNLVVDMRSFAMLHADGIPVIFDSTHSLQLPGGGQVTGGARQFAEPLARAAVAAGADGVFMEVHPRPQDALSDATTQLPPLRAERLLSQLVQLRRTVADMTSEEAGA